MTPRRQYQVASRLENLLGAIEARADTLLLLGLQFGEEHDERDGAALCQLARDIHRDVRRAEKRRGKLMQGFTPCRVPGCLRSCRDRKGVVMAAERKNVNLDRPPPGWHVLDVMPAGKRLRVHWSALLIDVDPDDIRERRVGSHGSCWFRIPGKHKSREAP